MKISKLKVLIKECKRKLSHHPELDHYPHFSFIFSKTGERLGGGTNGCYEPPIHWGYHKRGYKPKLHAEIRAYLNAKRRISGAFSIVNVRLDKDGEIKNSAPCCTCRTLLSALGCESFTYSISLNNWGIIC